MTKYELMQACEKARYDYGEKEQLYKCSADIIYTYVENPHTGRNFVVALLQSYSTITGVFFPDFNVVIEFDYWSHTSTQHFSKFIRFLQEENNEEIFEILHLYKRSDRIVRVTDFTVTKFKKEFEDNDYGEFLEFLELED